MPLSKNKSERLDESQISFRFIGIILSYIFLILLGGRIFFIFFMPIFLIYLFIERGEKHIFSRVKKILLIKIGSIVFIISILFLSVGSIVSLLRIFWDGPITHSYILSNGERNIVFQGLYHIGTQEYYMSIQSYLDEKKKDGYNVVFLERLGTGTIQNEQIFARATGYDDNRDELGSSLREANNLTKQSYRFLLKDFTGYRYSYVDLNVDEIIGKAHETYTNIIDQFNKKQVKSEKMSLGKYISQNITSLGKDYFTSFTILAFYFTPPVEVYTMRHEDIVSDLELNYRDDYLSDAILSSLEKKIVVLYGEGHIPGVFRNLKKADPRWQILETKEFRVFQK